MTVGRANERSHRNRVSGHLYLVIELCVAGLSLRRFAGTKGDRNKMALRYAGGECSGIVTGTIQ